MADLQNTQFYDWNPGEMPQSPKWWQSKRLQIILGGVVLLIVIGFILAGILVRRGGSSSMRIQEEANGIISRESSECDSASDNEACLSALRTRTARSLGAVAVCEGLTEDEYYNCVLLIAQEQKTLQSCDVLKNSEKQNCLDAITLIIANEKQDYGLCHTIVSEELKEACEQLTLGAVIAGNACATFGISELVCEDEKRYRDILASGTILDCVNLQRESSRENCEEMFRGIDSDDDGLSDADEVLIHRTDPRNPDTDGDGYDDGEEIDAGFNPRG